ncbi:CHAT domain-containing protein [Sediminitomix flava]|uniref:CHAT domain-containing protein n=2 Tax=Sediminitomix flava TaxID=379075 RepID=A0A315Z8Q6_SEDFL|nr:CHAT domain-containing protein [Sediminitomix flava]
MPFVKSHKDSDLLSLGHEAYKERKFNSSANYMQKVTEVTNDATTKAYAQYYLAYIYLRDVIDPVKCYSEAHASMKNFEKGNIESPRFYSRVLDLLGDYHNRVGNLDSAEFYYHKRYLFSKKNGQSDKVISLALTGLAHNLYQKQEFHLGENIQLYALGLSANEIDYSNYIGFLLSKDAFSAANEIIQKIDINKKSRINSNKYLYFLALAEIKNGNYNLAIQTLEKYIKTTLSARKKYIDDINKDTYLLTHFYIARAYWQQAYCYKALGYLNKGIEVLEIALKNVKVSMEAQAQRNLVLQSRIYRSLEEFHLESKHQTNQDFLSKSFDVLNQYLQNKADTNSIIHSELMYNYFAKAEQAPELLDKDKLYWQSYIHLKKFISKQYYDEDQLQHLASLKSLQDQLIDYFSTRFIATQKEDYLLYALEIAENAKSYILYKRNKAGQRISVDEYLAQDDIFQLKKEQRDSPLLLPNDIRSYFKKHYTEKGKSFLSYYLLKNKLLIVSLSDEKFQLHITHLSNRDLKLIDGIGKQLQASDFFIERSFIDKLEQLRMLLLPQNILKMHQESIVVSSHDKLSSIPLEVLPVGRNRHYLLEDHAISYAFSLHHDLLVKGTITAPNQDLSILGIAPFASKDLPFSSKEVKNISKRYIIDEEATRENILELYSEFDILHFATHANFDNTSNEAEIYLFSEGEKTGLSFEEIEELDFSNHKLISLSACYTGIGNYMDGEGVMSLQRAFAYSKAPSILASLWKVEDQASTFILKEFYNQIKKGSPKDEALRAAKLKYIEAYPVARMNPMFWGGMIISGNMDQVVREPWYNTLIFMLVLSIVLFGSIWKYVHSKRTAKQAEVTF